jgi:hypothetical protein
MIGYRQRFLLLTGVAFAALGGAVWYDATRGSVKEWLPVSALSSSSAYIWAGILIGVGVVLAAGCWWRPAVPWLFALGAAASTAWGASWVVHAVRFNLLGDWSTAVGWVAYALVFLLAASWPEPA